VTDQYALHTAERAFLNEDSFPDFEVGPWSQFQARLGHRLDRLQFLGRKRDGVIAIPNDGEYSRTRENRQSMLNIKAAEEISRKQRQENWLETSTGAMIASVQGQKLI